MEMAFRASAALKTSSSVSASRALSSPVNVLNKLKFNPALIALPTSTTLSLLALFTPPHEAKALTLEKDQIVSSLTEMEKSINQAQEVGSSVLGQTQRVFETVGNALKPSIEATAPLVQQAGQQAFKIASPVISEVSKKAQEALEASGMSTEPIVTAAKTVADAAKQTSMAIEGAKPIASTTVDTISSADPIVIVGTVGALFLAYLLLPPIWSVISYSLRGYKGTLTPAQALDLISTQNYLMVDIRSEKDKDKAGVPRLPSDAQNRMIAIPLEELPSKLKGLVRNVKRVEAEIAALKISFLKRINKSSNIVIMDSYSDSAKIVARVLTSLGFKNCWIVADGFSGSKGWLQSRLGTDSYNISFAQVLSPSRVIPAAVRGFGTISSSTKLLPGSK